jgi:DNA-binding transcriptional LysR family regulator
VTIYMTSIDLHQLEMFAAVMEFSTLTKAAEKIHLSPGAISLQLRDLAFRLHTDLFVKSGRRLAPTPDAIRLLHRVKPLLQQACEIEREFESNAQDDVRPVHFACGATTLIHALGDPLRQLRARFPKASIRITAGNTEEMIAGLLDHRFDLAIVTLPSRTANLRVVPLFEEELFIVGPAAEPAGAWRVDPISASELAWAPFLLHSERSNMRAIIDRFFDLMKITPNVVGEAEDVDVLRRLVESGFGYSVLPEMGLQRAPMYFKAFRVPGHKVIRTQALAMARSARPRPLTEWIAKFLKSALADSRSRSRGKCVQMPESSSVQALGRRPERAAGDLRCVFS